MAEQKGLLAGLSSLFFFLAICVFVIWFIKYLCDKRKREENERIRAQQAMAQGAPYMIVGQQPQVIGQTATTNMTAYAPQYPQQPQAYAPQYPQQQPPPYSAVAPVQNAK